MIISKPHYYIILIVKRAVSYRMKRTAAAVILIIISYIFAPVSVVEFTHRDGRLLLSSPLRFGQSFETEYIHSVQRTPVVDIYVPLSGTVWQWEERVQSHNAGLPFQRPEHGSFVMSPPWMILRGGRTSHDEIRYRVGSETLGRNIWRLPYVGEVRAYELYPNAPMVIRSRLVSLIDAMRSQHTP